MEQKPENLADRNAVGEGRSGRRGREGNGTAATTRVARARAENSIRPVKARPRGVSDRSKGPPGAEASLGGTKPRDSSSAANPAGSQTAAPGSAAHADAVPEHIRRRFVQVGRKYYFPDGERAFTDRGRRLTTRSENSQVIASLVAIAKARDWSEIAVRGTHRFRKDAWFAARLAGLGVEGYRPSALEQARLVRALARQQPEGVGAPSADRQTAAEAAPAASASFGQASTAREARGGLLAGTLLDHGSANYRHDPHEPMSYFVRIDTARGERVIWGVDLERALKESLTRPKLGDPVGLRAVRQDPVKVRTTHRDAQGQVIGEEALETHRNRWIIEQRDFFATRAAAAQTLLDSQNDPKQAVKEHPELAGSYLQMQAAKLASRRFRDPQDQERFVSQVRSALAESIARGEPLPPVRLRERAAAAATHRVRSSGEREPPAVRG